MRLKKELITILTIISISIVYSTAFAETNKEELFTLKDTDSVIINVEYEVDDVIFYMVSPDGDKVDINSEDYEVYEVKFENLTKLFIIDADEGDWDIVYDKGSNEYIEVSVEKYEKPLLITDFKITEQSGEDVKVNFATEHEEDISIKYNIYLMTEDNKSVKKLLTYGSSRANKEVEKKIDFSDVNSYDNYVLRLEVTYGSDYMNFDIAYSEVFSYSNANQEDALEDVDVYYNLTDNSLTVDWDDYLPWHAEMVYVRILDNLGEEIFSGYYEDETQCECTLSDDISEFEILVSYHSGGLISEKVVKQCKSDYIIYVDENFKEDAVISSKYYYLDYDTQTPLDVTSSVNGQESSTSSIESSGALAFTLQDGHNTIEAGYTYDGIYIYCSKFVFVDTIPPVIRIYEEYDGMHIKENSLIIAGSTDTDAQLMINDMPVAIDEDGVFTHEVEITSSENLIVVSADDAAGNGSRYEAIVYKDDFKEVSEDEDSLITYIKRYMMYGIGLIVSIILIIVAASGNRSKHKE